MTKVKTSKDKDKDTRKKSKAAKATRAKGAANPKAARKTKPRVSQGLVPAPRLDEGAKQDTRSRLSDLPGDLPSVTVKDESEALFYFQRIDDRLAEAWEA